MVRWVTSMIALALSPMLSADLAKGLDAAAASKWNEAYKEFKQSAERGNSSAQVNLGNLYMKGLGVEQSYLQALKWYEKAALLGNPVGQAKMGILYYYGLGVSEDPAKAVEWFIRAADQGDAEAALVLAQLYLGGEGINRNPKEAYLWSSVAAELGKSDATGLRAELARELSPRDLEETLTRLSAWLEQHSQRIEKAQRSTAKPPNQETTHPPEGPSPGRAKPPQDPAKQVGPSESKGEANLLDLQNPLDSLKKTDQLPK